MKKITCFLIALIGYSAGAAPVHSLDLKFRCPIGDSEYQDGLEPKREVEAYLNGSLIEVSNSYREKSGAQIVIEGKEVVLMSVGNMTNRFVIGRADQDLNEYRDNLAPCLPIDRWGDFKAPVLKITDIALTEVQRINVTKQCTEFKNTWTTGEDSETEKMIELADGEWLQKKFVTFRAYSPNVTTTYQLRQEGKAIDLTQSARISIPNDKSLYGAFLGFGDKANCLKLIAE